MARSVQSRSRRRRILPGVLVGALIVLIPLIVLGVSHYTSAFAVRTVVVTGAQRIPRGRAEQLLADRFMGHDLFSVGEADVRRALAEFTYLESVKVDRDFPTTLRIRLIEFEPAVFVLSRGRWYVLSQEGRVVAELPGAAETKASSASPRPTKSVPPQASPSPSASPSGAAGSTTTMSRSDVLRAGPGVTDMRLPVLRTDAELVVGATASDQRLLDALTVLNALSSELRGDAALISTEQGAVTIEFRGGLRVAFGQAVDVVSKMAALKAVLASYGQHRLTAIFVDVSVPTRPIGRPTF